LWEGMRREREVAIDGNKIENPGKITYEIL
jgi:hypothetical protein